MPGVPAAAPHVRETGGRRGRGAQREGRAGHCRGQAKEQADDDGAARPGHKVGGARTKTAWLISDVCRVSNIARRSCQRRRVCGLPRVPPVAESHCGERGAGKAGAGCGRVCLNRQPRGAVVRGLGKAGPRPAVPARLPAWWCGLPEDPCCPSGSVQRELRTRTGREEAASQRGGNGNLSPPGSSV